MLINDNICNIELSGGVHIIRAMRTPKIICIVVIVALVAWPAMALADGPVEVREYGAGRDGYLPKSGGYSVSWSALFIGLLSMAVVLAPAFKNARRTHLD